MDEPDLPPFEPADQARRRWRWLTLAEILGVAAVVISGLTLWNNYRERTDAAAARASERHEASAAAQILLLRGTPDREGERLSLAPADNGQTIQGQTIAFPAALGVAPVETVSDSRIEARWFARALLHARGDADAAPGDARLPVLITTRFFAGGAMHQDVAIYDLGYRIKGGGLLGGHDVLLRGLSRVERSTPSAGQARLDALWTARQ